MQSGKLPHRLPGAVLLLLAACSKGGGGTTPDTRIPQVELISPPTTSVTVDAPEIGVQIRRTNLVAAEVHFLGGLSTPATAYGDTLLVPRVPLQAGSNELRLVTRTATHTETTLITVVNTGSLPAPRWVQAERLVYGTPAAMRLAVDWGRPIGGATEVLFDREGDGTLDGTGAVGNHLDLEFPTEGTFQPLAVLRDGAGILLPTQTGSANISVVAAPLGAPQTIPGALVAFHDLVVDHRNRRLVVLDHRQIRVHEFDGTPIATVEVPGLVAPANLGVTDLGDVLITDPARGRITRLQMDSGYQPDPRISPDGSFGGIGNAGGNYTALAGVAALRHGFQELLIGADSTINRFQLASALGDHIGYRPQPTSALPLPVAPTSLRAAGAGLYTIEAGGAAVVRRDVTGAEVWRAASPVGAGNATFLAISHELRLVVTHGSTGTVCLHGEDGSLVATFQVPGVTAAAIGMGEDAATLFTVTAGAAQVGRQTIHLVPQDDGPRLALIAFLDQLRTGQYASAAAACEGRLRQGVAAIEPGSVHAQTLATRLSQVVGTTIVRRDSNTAHVRIQMPDGNDHDVFLFRNNAAWKVRQF